MIKQLIIFSLLCIFTAESCNDCGCYESCFSRPQPGHEAYYLEFRNIVESLRSAKEIYGVQGTAYLMDGSADSISHWNYQKYLATLIALTHTPSDGCNPFFVGRYHCGIAYAYGNWQCRNKCEAARILFETSTPAPVTPNNNCNWLTGGCLLTQWMATSSIFASWFPCQHNFDPANDMAIAFMNNNNQISPSSSWCTDFKVRAAVRIDGAGSGAGFATAPELDLQTSTPTPNNPDKLKALLSLNRCIINCCCGNEFYSASSFPGVRAENSADNYGGLLVNDGSDPRVLTADQLNKTVTNLLRKDGRVSTIKG